MARLHQIQIPLPTGSYQNNDLRASSKRLVNVYSEIQPQTSVEDMKQKLPPVVLRRWAGIDPLATTNTSDPVRGLWEMQNVVYAVIGQYLYTVNQQTGNLVQIGKGIVGTGFVRMCDNTACLFILVPNSTFAYTYCPVGGTGFAAYTNSTFTTYGAIDVNFCDSYFVFLAQNGREFYNDDGQAVSLNGPPTFTTGAVFPREFGTDPFVGFTVDHREPIFFGLRTTEGYVDAGNQTFSPFSSAPDSFMHIGAHPDCAYAIAMQDQSAFWVANDRTIRRRNGQTPLRVSNSGIEAILEQADLRGCYALTPSIEGHPLYVLTLPNEYRTIVYDCLTTEWFELESFGLGYWRALSYLNFNGLQYIGDSQSGQIGSLDTGTFTEFGNPMVCELTTQSVYSLHNRTTHRRVELVITPGQANAYNIEPMVTLYASDNSGTTFRPRPMRSLGAIGERKYRAVWFNLGQSRDRVYKFKISDPTPTFTVDITADISQDHW